MNKLETRLKTLITENGPIDIGTFMNLAIGHYYSTRDPFGARGDFTTAPEISQMFGEMIGVCFADAWLKMGSPAPITLVEAGPGRGTLMADILRAMKSVPGFHDAVQIHLIEMSPVLKERQKETLKDYLVSWHETLDSVPQQGPLFFVANEFLDALPMRQFQFAQNAWHERVVGVDGEQFFVGLIPTNHHLPAGNDNVVFETAPLRDQFVADLADRILQADGVALFIDYGHDQSGFGDTLQAVKDHKFTDALRDVGEADLTSHVDFGAVKRAAGDNVVVLGPMGQGDFLKNMGIEIRAAKLGQQAEMERLTSSKQMGDLFRVIALCHDENLELAGFPK